MLHECHQKLCGLDKSHKESPESGAIMDPVNVIRAPSLKRGKPDERLSGRVSIEFFPAIDYLLLLATVCGCLICQCEYRYVIRWGRRNLKYEPSSLELSAFKTKRNINRREKTNVIKNIVLRHQLRREMKIGSFAVALVTVRLTKLSTAKLSCDGRNWKVSQHISQHHSFPTDIVKATSSVTRVV